MSYYTYWLVSQSTNQVYDGIPKSMTSPIKDAVALGMTFFCQQHTVRTAAGFVCMKNGIQFLDNDVKDCLPIAIPMFELDVVCSIMTRVSLNPFIRCHATGFSRIPHTD